MQHRPLGRSGLMVSDLCLGTMTWGTQTPESEAHAQIDLALAHGVTILDTAEMYPTTPISAETIGLTEAIIGRWIAANPSRRGDVLVATKHSGAGMKHTRDGAAISSATIAQAVEGSLRRLQTDVIDLYQFHWPNRGSYMFRQNWLFDASGQDPARTLAHMDDALEALSRQVEKGNIRHFGLSNESAWGTTMWCRRAEALGAPRPVSVQNEYSLMCRLYDTDMAEMTAQEGVGLLAFSPLAAGLLTGKYAAGAVPEGSRMGIASELGGRRTPRAMVAAEAYVALARDHGLDPVHMALAFARGRPFMASVIFGATTLGQLRHALGAADVVLGAEVLEAIDRLHRAHAMPF